MTHDSDVERVARAILAELIAGRYVSAEYEGMHENADAALHEAARAALSAMPHAALLREAMEALDRVLLDVEFMWEDGTLPNRRDDVIYVRARAAADKIRAALERQQKGEPKP